jgi:hypothetical protein
MMKIMMRLMNRILPSCKEVSHLTSQAMDELLPLRKRIGLRLHLAMCAWCRRSAEQLKLMRSLAHNQALSRHEGVTLGSDARKRIADSLEPGDSPQ